eukprot:975679-Prymnesium_polylepis.1
MRGEPRPGGVRRCGKRASGGACQASGERGAGRHGASCSCAADDGGDSHAACFLYSKDMNTPVRS